MTTPARALVLLSTLALAAAAQNRPAAGVRFWSNATSTRAIVEVGGEFTYSADRAHNPERLFFDIKGARVLAGRAKGQRTIPVGDRLVRQIRIGQPVGGVTRIVFDLAGAVDYGASILRTPDRFVVEVRAQGTPGPASAPVISRRGPLPRPVMVPPPAVERGEPAVVASLPDPTRARERASRDLKQARPAVVPTDGDQSMARVLGLKVGRIVVDAGHGGHDQGTAGASGLLEKDLVLDVALRLGKLIEDRLGSEVVYTRNDDTFIPLEERTRIANREKADLFLSIHANNSPSEEASGVETFYLNFTTDKYALNVAARENAMAESTVHELKPLVERIALNDKVEESRQFAARVQTSLYQFSVRQNPRTRDRGIKKAPFVVLVGARMPSILCEIGFLSNARDEAMLRRGEYRQKLAEALYKGVAGYAGTLSHFQIATRK